MPYVLKNHYKDGNISGTHEFKDLKEVVKSLVNTEKSQDVLGILLMDTQSKVVEILKGELLPFFNHLNRVHPGRSKGTVN